MDVRYQITRSSLRVFASSLFLLVIQEEAFFSQVKPRSRILICISYKELSDTIGRERRAFWSDGLGPDKKMEQTSF
jgi:hypothetical protein